MISINETECAEIVRRSTKSENVKIENFESKNFGEELGFLGEYFGLRITAKINNLLKELVFFVKSLPIKDLKGRREMLIETGIFRKEVKVYEHLIAKFREMSDEVWCSNVYLLRDDLIVFEDMKLLGYETLPSNVNDFSQQCVQSTLNALANFHACSIAYEQHSSIKDEFEDILFETSVADIPWFRAGMTVIQKIAIAKNFLSKKLKPEVFYEKLMSTINLMEESVFNIPHVLCHRDIWRNNIMFNKQHSHCILIDFQTVRYLALTIDFLMAVTCTTRPAHYEKSMSHYIKFYYEKLQEKLTKFKIDLERVMSLENFQLSCDYYKQFALVYRVIIVMYTQVSPEQLKQMTNAEFEIFTTGDRFLIVTEFMRKDPLYDELLTEAVEKVVAFFLK